jgi:hypothetical protein
MMASRSQVDFQSSKTQLTYPNPNLFSDAHLAVLNASKKASPYLDYQWDFLVFPPHELNHCVQMMCEQSDEGGWALEHDASAIALVLAGVLSRHPQYSRTLFPAGKLEECVLAVLKLVRHTDRNDCKPEHRTGFAQYRASFGVVPPVSVDSFTFVGENQNVGDWFKYRISLETYYQCKQNGGDFQTALNLVSTHALCMHVRIPADGACRWVCGVCGVCVQILDTCFVGRIGTNITDTKKGKKAAPVNVPKQIALTAGPYSLEDIVKARMSAAELADFIAKCKL